MKDALDTLLYRLPSPPPPQNLAERIVRRVLAQKATSRAARRLPWVAGILGSSGTALLVGFFWEVSSALETFWPPFSDVTTWWNTLGALSATAFPLALALLALAAFLQAGYLLSAWAQPFVPPSAEGG